MICSKTEYLLSEYMEASLPPGEMEQVKLHLDQCPGCSALLAEMQSALALCRNFPSLDLAPDLTERILLRTSGRPRTRPLKEQIQACFLRPLMTPRFAFGAALALLFTVFMTNVMVPRMSGAVSSISSQGVLGVVDEGVRGLYGKALKAYETKNEWQAQFSRFRGNAWNSLRSIREQLDEPVQGKKKAREGEPRRDAPKDKSSRMWLLPA